jgi:hypothetical protein
MTMIHRPWNSPTYRISSKSDAGSESNYPKEDDKEVTTLGGKEVTTLGGKEVTTLGGKEEVVAGTGGFITQA